MCHNHFHFYNNGDDFGISEDDGAIIGWIFLIIGILIIIISAIS